MRRAATFEWMRQNGYGDQVPTGPIAFDYAAQQWVEQDHAHLDLDTQKALFCRVRWERCTENPRAVA